MTSIRVIHLYPSLLVRSTVMALLVLVATMAAAEDRPDSTRIIDTAAAWVRVSEAREAAGDDRHEDAAQTYLEALANDARLVPTVAAELAYQKLWREDADKAIFYFRRYLARHPDQSNHEVRQGLALAYSWSGRQREAIALYRDLVAEDPTDDGSRLGLGRSLVWDNRLRAGTQVLLELENDRAGDTAGRQAGDFLLTVLDGYDPNLDVRWDSIRDSDDLTINRLTARGRSNLGNVLVEALVGGAWYDQPNRPAARAPRVGLGAVAPLARNWQIHAYGWVDRFTSDGPPASGTADLDWTFLGADAWLTWLATNRLRLDLGAGRSALETYDAFAKELRLDQMSLSADWRPWRHWTVAGVLKQADLSDDNRRRQASLRAFWRREGRLEWRLGPALSYMDHTDPYPGGYWAPDWVRSGRIEANAIRRWARTTLRIDGSLGLEKELGADVITVGSVSVRLAHRIAARWLVAVEAGHSRSKFTSDSGYNRTLAGINVRALF